MSDIQTLQQFLDDNSVPVPGARTRFVDFIDRFLRSLPVDERPEWDRQRIERAVDGLGLVRGVAADNYMSIANLQLIEHKYVKHENKLIRQPV